MKKDGFEPGTGDFIAFIKNNQKNK